MVKKQNDSAYDNFNDLVDTLSMTGSELAANRQRKKMNKGVIEAINSFESIEIELNGKILNTLLTNFNLLQNILEKQNKTILEQNQLLIGLLSNNIENDDTNSINEYLQDNIPKKIECSYCNKEFYSTNKSYYENQKCPYCDTELNDVKPLKIKKTGIIEKGICPYCESEIHTNDLICPFCFEKLTPIYDKLLETKLKEENEKQERDKRVLWDNEEEIFKYYSNLVLNDNYTEKNAMIKIITNYNITNQNIFEKFYETKNWDEKIKIEKEKRKQSKEFLKENEEKMFEDYTNLIIYSKYSQKKAKNEIIKKYNITDTYIIKKLDGGILNKWDNKIYKERLEKERLEKERLKKENICSKCGIKNEIDNNFCINCGNKL